jgi:hypothetical protein
MSTKKYLAINSTKKFARSCNFLFEISFQLIKHPIILDNAKMAVNFFLFDEKNFFIITLFISIRLSLAFANKF